MKKLLLALCLCWAALQAGATAKPEWLTDFSQAQAKAKAEHKLVLLNFTGTDWCPACMELEKKVFAKPEFAEYAAKNLVLVLVDFPDRKPQPEALQKANLALKDKFGVDGFPTLIVLDSDGKKVWTETGYDLVSGPKAYIAKLEKLKKN